MLLAIDIGNTHIHLGVFDGPNLLQTWKMQSSVERTCDEYKLMIFGFFQSVNLGLEKLDGAIISSVVPPLTPLFQQLCQQLFKVKALILGPGLKTGMPILYENPAEVGADRVAGAVAAYEKYGGPVIVVDLGTATTFDAVSARGEYLGGAIAPGIQISAEALTVHTAKLPRVEISKPRRTIGRTTVASMHSGIYIGYIGLITHLVNEIKKELGHDARVVATGGLASLIAADVPVIDKIEPYLVLEGLRIIYERNKT
ncbi:MAG: type III pantothenate kinase [Candidatus Aminicenantes bacterium]|nr:type III pantothenate kinase [Candidatus Aminicenantes bacterium]